MSTVYYRTKDGLAYYKFSFESQSDGTWRAYILDLPSYGSRDTSLHVTHRLNDGGRKYVCWNAPLQTEADARKVAALWADATQRYIREGKTIDEQMRESG